MIGKNPKHHDVDDDPMPEYDVDLNKTMPEQYREMLTRVQKLPKGKKALGLYKKFWGLPYPTEIQEFDVPGPPGTVVMVGMGTSPQLNLADGPKGKHSRKWNQRGRRMPAVDADGKKIWLFTGKNSKARDRKVKRLGFVPETHYIPTSDMESAGTFKKRTYWVHKHSDDGGQWPEAFQDQAGNIEYRGGTCRVGKWMER